MSLRCKTQNNAQTDPNLQSQQRNNHHNTGNSSHRGHMYCAHKLEGSDCRVLGLQWPNWLNYILHTGGQIMIGTM